MEDVDVIYHNDTGISFKWKNGIGNTDENRVQLVFKDMGFYLLPEEVMLFSENIRVARRRNPQCFRCLSSDVCERNILLKSPLQKMDFAVNAFELNEICDLVEGTIFKLQLNYYLEYVAKN
ncbi:MAG: hypothetical protein CMP12_18130 [Zunongwangia sp.]|uniref:Uncharacterized protein n=2 Tax=Zunongwangia profunda TaxID=398743 RepID=D5BCT6_ZUNPS|nr:hypothetical protein [Zunongwangia profunda]MAC63887.1 hypothetical protein [Flavobacteriaceae bacterium]MAO37790.1 hypothetical protein [Zunongwangia sp.]ADF50599.1 conserved hypothetical protein [Zunongwangia profunda SM-A87]MAS69915.1 hypothetical protein [Zunongwangia sp.]HAJ82363.1 hypothetical protein [Zunongwangia profunda]|tara:strand:+ start:340 stop:702 length:363 start_codon:yes stop_codon:yes gene_type:complete